ncbi:MAG: tetratricopeptide repeat protein [Dysgonamonadaceae bacterium]|jgi:tetratricopeptide (TPR) repeat protein|nr:tetratricopeptide repeat protein [Dysgonamonadaceae bacterium]
MNRIVVLFGIILSISSGLYAQTYSEWIESSFHYLDENRLDSAEIALKNALRTEPDNPLNAFLFQNLGTLLRRQGKNREALEFYTLALRRYPQNATILSDRASLNAETGDFISALIDYNTLLEQEPDNEEALYQRGLLNLKIKKLEQSEIDFQKMLEINPASLYARLGLASLYIVTGKLNEAETVYYYIEGKVKETEILSKIYAGRAEIYLLKEKGGRALTEINKAIHEEPENPYFYIIRSRAKLLLHEKQPAAEDIRKAIDLGYDVKDAEALLQLTK